MTISAKTAASLLTTRSRLGLRGVSLSEDKGKYFVAIGKGRTRRFLGYYNTAIEAAQVYDREARKLYGPLAALNFPLEGERAVRPADDPLCVHGHDLEVHGVMTRGRVTPACKECWRLGRARLKAKAKAKALGAPP